MQKKMAKGPNPKIWSTYEHQHQPSPTVTNRHQPSPTVTNRHQPSPTVTNRHQPSPTVTNRHQPSPTVTNRHQPSPTVTNRHQPSHNTTTMFWVHKTHKKLSISEFPIDQEFLGPSNPSECRKRASSEVTNRGSRPCRADGCDRVHIHAARVHRLPSGNLT